MADDATAIRLRKLFFESPTTAALEVLRIAQSMTAMGCCIDHQGTHLQIHIDEPHHRACHHSGSADRSDCSHHRLSSIHSTPTKNLSTIERQSMFFEVSTRILLEPSVDAGFIDKHYIGIGLSRKSEDYEIAGLPVPEERDEEGFPVAKVGAAVVERLHIDLTESRGVPLYNVCDADSGEWEDVFAAFLATGEEENKLDAWQLRLDERSYYKANILEECCTGDVLLIRDIATEPAYQGRGIEMAIADRILETLGAGCDLAVYYYGDHVDELERYKLLGFREGPVAGFAYLELNFLHPSVEEVTNEDGKRLCHFKAVEDEDKEPDDVLSE